jgi:hypothetical protein
LAKEKRYERDARQTSARRAMSDEGLFLGTKIREDGTADGRFALPPHHLVTHGIVLGMTGSGKTGLLMVLVEEALRAKTPVLMVDVKGDLPNLLYLFPSLAPEEYAPWIDEEAARRASKTKLEVAGETSARWREGLSRDGLAADDVAALARSVAIRVVTPGATIAEPLDVLSALSRRSALWGVDDEAAHDELSSGLCLLLRLAGLDGDPRSKEHVVLSALAMRRLERGEACPLATLLSDLLDPPVANVGAMPFDEFFPPGERRALAQGLNALLASPRLAGWLKGAPLDVAGWLAPRDDGRTPAVIVSVAHLDDEERLMVLGLVADQILSYVRAQSGTSSLRALCVFDEIFGFLPPHPQNPPTKRPLLALMKQARAFGVGVVLATQNPMDVDYKALSNAGAWIIGRLQTDADRERVVEGLRGADGGLGELEPAALAGVLRNLPGRTFFVRDVHAKPSAALLRSRFAMTWLRGPLTRRELTAASRALGAPAPVASTVPPPAASADGAGNTSGRRDELPRSAAPPAASADGAGNTSGRRDELPGSAAPPAASADGAGNTSAAPPGPADWSTRFAAGPGGGLLTPWVLATVVVRLRHGKLPFATERRASVAQPFDEGGRLDATRARYVDPSLFSRAAPPDVRFAELPAVVGTKKGRETIERAFRDYALAASVIDVESHPDLGLIRGDGEPREAFLARCHTAAQRDTEERVRRVVDKVAPDLARLDAALRAAQLEHSSARAAVESASGDLGAALVGLAWGRLFGGGGPRAGHTAPAALDRAAERWRKAEVALREAIAARDAEIAAVRAEAARFESQLRLERIVPKKGDAEVVGLSILWHGA